MIFGELSDSIRVKAFADVPIHPPELVRLNWEVVADVAGAKALISLSLIIGIILGTNCYAQESVPKEVLLTTLNSVNDLKLSNLKTTELMAYNEGFVDKIFDIIESDKSEKDKKSALGTLNNDTERDLTDLLGKKDYKKYAKLMEAQLKPLTKKSKLLKELF